MISSLYLHSESSAKPLRIGVMVDDFVIAGVFRQVLTDIQASDFANLELVIVNRQPPSLAKAEPASKTSRYLRLLRERDRRRLLLYTLYQNVDKRRRMHPDPLDPVDTSDILGTCQRVDVTPITKKFVHRFPPEAIEAIRSFDLDVILRFGFNILRGEVLAASRYGVWSFHHGDNEFYRGGPALFWEVVEDNPCSGVILQVLTEKLDDGMVLCKSLFATRRGLSRNSNVFYPYWGSAHFVIRKLHQLHEGGWEAVKEQVVPTPPYQGKTEIYRLPSNSQMTRWLLPRLAKKIARFNPLTRDKVHHWRIGLRRADSPKLIKAPLADKSGFRWINDSPGHFYADPFLINRQGQTWLFFEDFLYGERRGRINCAPVNPDSSIGDPSVCLDLPYHLSYPLVFCHAGETFMIPESVANESVELWRAIDFPFSWKLEKTLFRGSLVDTTPILHEGRWYFFTAMTEPQGNAAFGALFSSNDLTGDWVRHPACPISTDVRYARSAGAIVSVDGRLLRPVQDCSWGYGHCIHVEEILELTPEVYRGRHLHSIEPDGDKGLSGVHTYAFCDGIEVIDAYSLRSRKEVAP